ncbi:MAG: hypothetical protein V5A28_09800 [Haloarculaceae archaeon]
MERWRDEPEVRLTLALLAGAAVLVAPGTLGVGGSLLLVAGVAVLAVAWVPLGEALLDSPWRRVDPHGFAADLWVGFLIAAVVVVLFPDATPGELQALGGLVGLAGMCNYFLRPVYRLAYGVGRRLAGV